MSTTETTTTEQAPEATPAATPTTLTFVQPDKKAHVYNSSNVEGYTVSVNEDRKSWTASFNGTPIVTDAVSRALATKAANNHLNPPAEGESTGEKKAPALSARDFAILDAVKSGAGSVVDYGHLGDITELELHTVMGVVAQLGRKGLLALVKNGVTLTEAGEKAHETYTPAAKAAKTSKPKTTVTSEEAIAAREARMEEKYGKPDPSIGPRPTALEYQEGRLENAQSSLKWAILDQRMHRYSPIAQKKVDNARERVQLIEKELEELRNPGAVTSTPEATTSEE